MKTEQQLDDAIARLSREMEPATDLWPAIAVQLPAQPPVQPSVQPSVQQTVQPTPQEPAQPVSLLRPARDKAQQSVRRHWWASAAAVVFGVTLWQQWPLGQAGFEAGGGQVATEAAIPAAIDYGLAQSQQQIRLAEKLQLMQLQKIPAGFANWQQQLAVWQQASEQVTLALTTEPNNLKLIRKLNRLQQQQLNYIRKLVATSQLS